MQEASEGRRRFPKEGREHQKTMPFEPPLPPFDRSLAKFLAAKRTSSYSGKRNAELEPGTSSNPIDVAPEDPKRPVFSHRLTSEPAPKAVAESTKTWEPLVASIKTEEPPIDPVHQNVPNKKPESAFIKQTFHTFPAKSKGSTQYAEHYESEPYPRRQDYHEKRRQNFEESQISDFRGRQKFGYTKHTEFRKRQEFENSRIPDFRRRQEFRGPHQYSGYVKSTEFKKRPEFKNSNHSNYGRRRDSESSREAGFRRHQDFENRGSPSFRNSANSSDFRRQNLAETSERCENREYGIFGEDESQRLDIFKDSSIPSTSSTSKFDVQKNLINTLMSSSTNDLLRAGYSQEDVIRLEHCQKEIEAVKWKLEEIDRNRQVAREDVTAPRAREFAQYPAHWFPRLSQCAFMPDGSLQFLGSTSESGWTRGGDSEDFGRRQQSSDSEEQRRSRERRECEFRRRRQWDSNGRSQSRRRQDSESPPRQSFRAKSIAPRGRQSLHQCQKSKNLEYRNRCQSQMPVAQHRRQSSGAESSESRRHEDSGFGFCRTPDSSVCRSRRTSEASGESEDIQILKVVGPIQIECSIKRRYVSEQEKDGEGAELAKKSKANQRPGPFYNTDQRRFEEEYDKALKEHEEKMKRKAETEGMHAISSLCREKIRRHLGRLQNASHCKLRVSSHRQLSCYYNVEIYDAKEPEAVKKAGEHLDDFSFEMIREKSEECGGGTESFIYNIPEGVRKHLMSSRYKARRDQIKRFTGLSAIVDLEIGTRNCHDLNLPLHFEGRAEPLHNAKLAFDRLVAEIQTILDSPIVEVEISEELIKLLLRNEGEGIRRIQVKSKTWIQLEKNEENWTASIQGAPDDVEMAKTLLAKELKVAEWTIPQKFRSRLVGKKGANINKIRGDSGATCHLHDVGEDGYSNLEIRGREKEVKIAERLVGECLARLEEEDEKAAGK